MSRDSSSFERLPFYESAPLALLLFAFWVVLSGKIDLFHLSAGALSSIGIAFLSCYLYAVEPYVGSPRQHPFYRVPWARVIAYLPWLAWQIVIASFQVALVVLSPRMNLVPRLFTFHHSLPHNLARATLANSITLTPGTVTIDVRGDEFLVHALNAEAAEGLEGSSPGDMKARVSAIFSGESGI